MNYYTDVVLKKYAEFDGRARRKEYWMFMLISLVVVSVLGILDDAIDMNNILGNIYAVLTGIPCLALGARRLHDIGKSGWWLLLLLIPVVGWIMLIVYACKEGEPGDNQYGPNPKAVSVA